MSPSDQRRTFVRTAVLDLVASTESELGVMCPEEREFLEALRRIVERSPAEVLWDKYRGSQPDSRARIFARFAD